MPTIAYLTVQEVAELARCEHKAVRRAITTGLLEAFRPTKRLLIREEDALAWIEGRPAAAARQRPGPQLRRGRRPPAGSVAKLREMEREAVKPRLF